MSAFGKMFNVFGKLCVNLVNADTGAAVSQVSLLEEHRRKSKSNNNKMNLFWREV